MFRCCVKIELRVFNEQLNILCMKCEYENVSKNISERAFKKILWDECNMYEKCSFKTVFVLKSDALDSQFEQGL